MSLPTSSFELQNRISFTSCTPTDFDKLADMRIAAMKESLERVGRFDPQRARDRLRKTFAPEHTFIIALDSIPVGFYALRPVSDGVYLDHLYVVPSAQNQRIGSYVPTLLIKEHTNKGAIRVGALKESASNRFYRRHGFIQEREDEWDTYYILSSTLPELKQ